MAVNSIIECYSADLVHKSCHGLESSVVYTAPPIFVVFHPGRSNGTLRRLLLRIHAEEIILTFLMLNIYMGLCLPKALTLTQLQLLEMFKVLQIVRINNWVRFQGIPNFALLRDAFLYRPVGGIPPQEGIP